MNRLLVILFGIVSTGTVMVLLLLLYRYANQNNESTYVVPLEKNTYERLEKSVSGGERRWLENLAVRKRPSYTYPVTEVEIDLPLREKTRSRKVFRLVLSRLDGYKMFCLKQLLERKKIRYAVYRRGENGILMIHDLDRKHLDRIVELVKDYDVNIETENYKKDQDE